MVWSEVCYVEHGLPESPLRGKRAALEVCCEENGMVWRSAARRMAWFGCLLPGKWSALAVCLFKVVWFVGILKIVCKGDKI